MGYDPKDIEAGGNGYIPIPLQYRPYTAKEAREKSIATDPNEPIADRNYRGKRAYAQNECDLDMLIEVHEKMCGKPVIVVIAMSNPTVLSEVEPLADAILIGFSVQTQAFLDLIFGKQEPSGLLPFELPASMSAVERHCEDKPHDIEPYCDADGNVYGFAYGLNFNGVITDERTRKYGVKKSTV
ncbi:MAG: glycoside hydrolase family 3 C-terminal domain-containing protein, partial [Muribaculaceae bacterium]